MVGLKKLIAIFIVAMLLCMAAPAFAQTTQTGRQVQSNIVQTAVDAGNFKTLTGAIDAAGLKDTLSSDGPYTVFAPTDDAFKKLSAVQSDALMKDKTKLQSVLKYHVVKGRYTSAELAKMGTVQTLDGKTLKVTSSDHAIAVDGAHIVKNDVPAGNGIIQVVDTVMIPK
jgi:uncharacterized surface protein with fasciclin (FAS1) repeats